MKQIELIVITNDYDEPTAVAFDTLGGKAADYLMNEEGLTKEQADTLFKEEVLRLEDADNTEFWVVHATHVIG